MRIYPRGGGFKNRRKRKQRKENAIWEMLQKEKELKYQEAKERERAKWWRFVCCLGSVVLLLGCAVNDLHMWLTNE